MNKTLFWMCIIMWVGFASACGDSGTDSQGSDGDADTDSDTDSDADSDSDTDTDADSDADADADTNTDGEPPLQTITFTESMENFPNPERGFYHARELPDAGGFNIRDEGYTLVYGRISADDFRDIPFTQEYLDDIQDGFDLARENGIKVNPRVAYNSGPSSDCSAQYGCDAPKDIIMQHIEQLAPLWQTNKDVINVLDAGFIGGWGEWHTSSNGLDNPTDRWDIMSAELAALPEDRMIVQRYPRFKREMFCGSETCDTAILSVDEAFNGSAIARIGHLNDCFLSSSSDVGTYQNLNDGWPLSRELEYIGAESPFVPWGGETCSMDDRGLCENAVAEMEQLHINYLNIDYNGGVLDRWEDDGCFDEIELRIGYRFVLVTAAISSEVKPGGVLRVQISLNNVGFGELFNPRDVELVLYDGSTEHMVTLPDDPRFWGAGETSEVSVSLGIPNSIAPGNYSLGIRMPDKTESIHDDVRYAVRFANDSVWQETSGINQLTDALVISDSAVGSTGTYSELTLID